MSEDVDDPWRKDADVKHMTPVDFQTRNFHTSFYGSDVWKEVVKRLADAHDLNNSEVIDRAIRVYLAYLLDSPSGTTDKRMSHEVTILIPPRGWVDSQGQTLFPEIEIEDLLEAEEEGGTTYKYTIPRKVNEMIEDVMDSNWVDVESKTQFTKNALTFLARGCST